MPSLLTPDQLARLSVVVVEDNIFMRDIIADLVRQAGVKKVYVADNGREAIEILVTFMPQVVLTDWNMPGITGLDLVKWIRQSPNSPNPSLPVILITGNNHRKAITQARDAGVTEFIVKPVTTQAILARLQTSLNSPRPFVQGLNYVGPCRRRRGNVHYEGVRRRLDDATVVDSDALEDGRDHALAAIEKDVAALMSMAKHLDVKDRKQLLGLRERVQRTERMAQAIGDRELALVCQSLIELINAVGASGELDQELVLMHCGGMRQILDTDGKLPHRREMATGLQSIVKKRLHKTAG